MRTAMGRLSDEPIRSIVDQEIRFSQAVPQSETSGVLSYLVSEFSFVADQLNRVWDNAMNIELSCHKRSPTRYDVFQR